MRKINYKYVLLTILTIIVFNLYFFNYSLKPPLINNHQFRVVETKKYSYYLKNTQGKVLLKTTINLNKNDLIYVKGKIEKVQSINNESLFKYDDYLKSVNIFFQVKSNNIRVIEKGKKTKTNNSKIDTYFNYMFLMDNEGIDDKVVEALKDLMIIHIIVVSGFHFSMLKKIMKVVFFFINNHYLKDLVIYSLLFLYLGILNFTIPALRMYVYLLLCLFNNKSRIFNHCSACLILLFINPLNILSTSYLLSVYVNTVILLLPYLIKQKYILKQIFIYLYMVPLNLMLNFQISILGIIYNIIYSFVINIIYCFLVLAKLFDFIKPTTSFLLYLFEESLILINKYNIKVILGVLPVIAFVSYLILLLGVTKFTNKYRKGYLSIMLPIMIIGLYYYIPSIEGYVAFINVGQGDCILIKAPMSDEAMMIDVAKPYKQNTVHNIILPFLNAHKIKSIEYLVITHDDIDHSGGKNDLIKNFNVKKIIDHKQAKIKYGPYLFIDPLAKKNFKDKNSNSITLYSRINNLNYFFTGDITKDTEYELASIVKSLPVDILKVAHHGSKSSTSDKFLDLTNPKLAVVSAGADNRYHHPHEEVLKSLNWRGIYVYKTFINGTIRISNIFIDNWLTTIK